MSDDPVYNYLYARYHDSSSFANADFGLREFFAEAVAYGRRQLATAGTPYWTARERIREALQSARDSGYINDFAITLSGQTTVDMSSPPPGREMHDLRAMAITEARLGTERAVQERDQAAYRHAVDRLTHDEEVQTQNVAAFFFNRGVQHGRARIEVAGLNWQPMTHAPRDGSCLLVRVPSLSGGYRYTALQHARNTEPALWLGDNGVAVSSDDAPTMSLLSFVRMPTNNPPTVISAAPPPTHPATPQDTEPAPMRPRPNRRMGL